MNRIYSLLLFLVIIIAFTVYKQYECLTINTTIPLTGIKCPECASKEKDRLVKCQGRPEVYLVQNGHRRHVLNMKALEQIQSITGYKVETISCEEIKKLKNGADINEYQCETCPKCEKCKECPTCNVDSCAECNIQINRDGERVMCPPLYTTNLKTDKRITDWGNQASCIRDPKDKSVWRCKGCIAINKSANIILGKGQPGRPTGKGWSWWWHDGYHYAAIEPNSKRIDQKCKKCI